MSHDIGKARTHGRGSGPFAFPEQRAIQASTGGLALRDIAEHRTAQGGRMFHDVVRRAGPPRRGTLRRMADKDPAGDGPSLELPSFGFGRKKAHSERPEEPRPRPGTEATPDRARPRRPPGPEVPGPPESRPPSPTAARSTPLDTRPPSRATRAPRPDAAARQPPWPPRSTRAVSRVAAPGRARASEPAPAPDPEPRRARRPRWPARRPVRPSQPAGPARRAAGRRRRRPGSAVAADLGSLRLCDAATGTASCGGGPGLLMLLAILIALTYLGGWLLRGFGISDAGSTSFLAVGLLAVVAMLFLVDSLDEWTGAVAVPLVTSWRRTPCRGGDRDAGRGRAPTSSRHRSARRRRPARRSARC